MAVAESDAMQVEAGVRVARLEAKVMATDVMKSCASVYCSSAAANHLVRLYLFIFAAPFFIISFCHFVENGFATNLAPSHSVYAVVQRRCDVGRPHSAISARTVYSLSLLAAGFLLGMGLVATS